MTDIANLTPEESFKAGLPIVLQLEAWIAEVEERLDAMRGQSSYGLADARGELRGYQRALALVTAKDADHA